MGREAAIIKAQQIYGIPNILALDIETTGLIKDGQIPNIIQISLVDLSEKIVFSTLVYQPKEYDSNFTGIRRESTKAFPHEGQVMYILEGILRKHPIMVYNASFDVTIIKAKLEEYGMNTEFVYYDIMPVYAEWYGEWNDKHQDWKYQKLPKLCWNAAHDANNDNISAIRVLKRMVGMSMEESIDLDW